MARSFHSFRAPLAELADAEEGQKQTAGGHLPWSACAAILATYSASSSTAFMPYIFGRLGYVAAAMMLGFYLVLCGWLQQNTLRIALRHPDVRNMPALAELVAGRFGRSAYQFLQIANQQLFLPCAMLFVIKSLKQIVLPSSKDGYVHPNEFPGALGCNVTWVFVILAFAVLVCNLQRRFGHAANLCKVTCIVNVVQVLLILSRVFANPADPSGHDNPGEPFPRASLSLHENDRDYWADIFTAFSSFGYCYVPCFIVTEAMQELEDKSTVHKALWSSTLYMFILYTTVGIFPVVAWGWDRPYEVLEELQGTFAGRTANLMLFLASAMDFVITGISLNQRLQETVDPSFDPHDWSARSCAKWFLLTLPSLTVTFLMLCFTPQLDTLVGLMTTFVVPFSQVIGPATLTVIAASKGMLGYRLSVFNCIGLIIGFCVGIMMLIIGGSATIKSIFFNGSLVKGNFFCEVVAG